MHKFTFPLLSFFLLAACQSTAPNKQLINSVQHQWFYDNWNLSQAVKVGNQLWLSGQVGTDPKTGQAPESLEAAGRINFPEN
ncbi:RidA family protein [Kangiella sp. TOML190]|uniref:RidA family protein n=1 Tax=Kangiella sp. TOML190 TaxID=2931351 RepID=UPI00203AF05C|nr:RidA family protein [Kangiella sp. TOML190]